MMRIVAALALAAGFALPTFAGELDREKTVAKPATPTVTAAKVAGSELDGETPEQSWRRGGWYGGAYYRGGWGGYSSFYRPYYGGYGWGGYNSFYRPYRGGFGVSFYAPIGGYYGGYYGGGCW